MAKSGMEMMLESVLKSAGVDLSGLKEILNAETVKSVISEVRSVSSKLDALDDKLTRIEIKLETIPTDQAMKLLSEGELNARDAVNKMVNEYNSAPIDVTGTFGGEVGALERMLGDGRGNRNNNRNGNN